MRPPPYETCAGVRLLARRGFAVRAMPGAPAEVVACRAARPSASPEVSDGERSDGALAIGGTHRRFRVGRHMRGLAWPSCRPPRPRDRNRHDTAARGGLLQCCRSRALGHARVTNTAVVSSGCASARRPLSACHREALGSSGGPAATRDGLSTPWPMCALVGGRLAVEPAWIFAGLSALLRHLSTRPPVAGRSRQRVPVCVV